MRFYWVLECHERVGWVAFQSNRDECKIITSDSENEEVFACVTSNDLSDYEMMFGLDIVNPEELSSFELNEIELTPNPPYRFFIRGRQAPPDSPEQLEE